MGQTPSQPDPFSEFNPQPPTQPTKRVRFRHPVAVFFHVIFKVLSLLVYLFGSAFGHEFLGLFVTLVFLISFDFWVVKNVTGRLLAGLRWWNYIDDQGQSHWVFENGLVASAARAGNQQPGQDAEFILFNQDGSMGAQHQLPPRPVQATGSDATVFWVTLFLLPILWFFLMLSAVFSLNIHWALFVALALVMSGSNLYGYLRCRFGTNYSTVISDYVGPKMFLSMMRSAATAAASSGNAATASNTTVAT